MTLPIARAIWRVDPWSYLLDFLSGSATPMVRSPRRVAALFLTEGALISPEELHVRLGPESSWVLAQYQPPFWRPAPPETIGTPLLWVAAGADAAFPKQVARPSADYYGANYRCVEDTGHDLMLERSSSETARGIHKWLAERVA